MTIVERLVILLRILCFPSSIGFLIFDKEYPMKAHLLADSGFPFGVCTRYNIM
jgi:hypothetical protein